jgi:hypothetical protein
MQRRCKRAQRNGRMLRRTDIEAHARTSCSQLNGTQPQPVFAYPAEAAHRPRQLGILSPTWKAATPHRGPNNAMRLHPPSLASSLAHSSFAIRHPPLHRATSFFVSRMRAPSPCMRRLPATPHHRWNTMGMASLTWMTAVTSSRPSSSSPV